MPKAGWIFLYDRASSTFSLVADVNLPPSLLVAGKRRMSGDCRCLQMLRDGQLTQPVNVIPCLRLEQALADRPERHQHACIPLLSQNDNIVGILNLLLPPGRTLSETDLDILEALGHEVAVAIERARLFETVRDREAEARELMQRLMAAQEEERRRIAQDLHDHAGQMLTALIIQLAHLAAHPEREEQASISATFERLHNIAQEGYDQLHRLVYDLRPVILDERGLAPAVRAYVESLVRPAGLEVDLKIVGLETRLPRDIEVVGYRIVQEAVTNALRHAQARRLEIRLDRRSDWLIVLVRDDGKGFDVEQGPMSKKNLGLYGMRERAGLVGGTLQVLSAQGVGTTILARLPFLKAKDP